MLTEASGATHNYGAVRTVAGNAVATMPNPNIQTKIDNIQTQGSEVVAWTTATAAYTNTRGTRMRMTKKCAYTLKRTNGGWLITAVQNFPKMD